MTGVIRPRAQKPDISSERQGGAGREVRMSSLDTFRHLREDHDRMISELNVLSELAGAPSHNPREIDELRGLVVLLERECAAHMRAEEEALFPALAGSEWMSEAAKSIPPLQAEHV